MGNSCAKFFRPSIIRSSSGKVNNERKSNTPATGIGGHVVDTPSLKLFTIEELKSATSNFKPDTMLGEGGFGRVFKGWVDQRTLSPTKPSVGIPVAVKISNPDGDQGFKEWQAEVRFLGKLIHPNLVKLLGYCWGYHLVYEYMQRGSLASHLFRKDSGDPIPWETRMKIATGAARGLAFLHSTEKQIIYRDFKSANILLDKDFNAKLSDFGFAKFGPINGNTHVSTQVFGTHGYAAPEYVSTGHLYVRSDVYGFGVVLLELITGLRVLDQRRPKQKVNLVDWAKPLLTSKKKVVKIMDVRLNDSYPLKGAYQVAALIVKCLEPNPNKRPQMEDVLEELELISQVPMETKNVKPESKPVKPSKHRDSVPRYTNHVRTGPRDRVIDVAK